MVLQQKPTPPDQPQDDLDGWDEDAFASLASNADDDVAEYAPPAQDIERMLNAISGGVDSMIKQDDANAAEDAVQLDNAVPKAKEAATDASDWQADAWEQSEATDEFENVSSEDVSALLQALGSVADSAAPVPDQASASSPSGTIRPATFGTLDDAELAEAFVQDASRGVALLDQAIIDLESGGDREEALASICRELHTIKGAASTVGLSDVGRYLHEVEDYVQSDGQSESNEFIEAMLACAETVRRQIAVLSGSPAAHDSNQSNSGSTETLGRIDPVGDAEDAISVKASQLDRLLDMLTALVMLRNRRESRVDELRRVNDEVNRCGARLREVERRFTAEFEADTRDFRLEDHSNPLREVANDLIEIKGNLREAYEPVAEENASVSNFIRQFRQALVTMLRMPVSGLFRRLQRAALDAARVENKKVKLEVVGADVGLERSVQERLFEPLLHIIRNSVGHGIELPEEREAAGKDPVGTITLEATGTPNLLVLSIRDDGKGLNFEAIKRRGLEKGLLSPDREATEDELAQLIFKRGFSTRETTNSVAGRGIGMDVVADTLDRMHAWIEVKSESGKGTTTTLTIPLRSIIEHSMVVRAGGQLFALPMSSLVNANATTPQELLADDDFANVLGLNQEDDGSGTVPLDNVIAVEAHGSTESACMRFSVEEIVGPEEVVVRPLPPLLRQQKLFSGVTLSGSGEVVLVIDPVRLAEVVLDREFLPAAPATRAKQLRQVLIVDDSLSARRAASNLWQQRGWQPTECVDGPSALQTLSSGAHFDVLVTDFDMPGMTGLELVRAIREQEQYNDLPLVMLSSRTHEEMESQVLAAGAIRYLQKPISEEKLNSVLTQLDAIHKPS